MASNLKVRSTPDLSSFLGLAVGLGGILGGLMLEGGQITDVSQLTAALIVVGGTLGAVMITTPADRLVRAFRKLKLVFFQPAYSTQAVIDELIDIGIRARRNGIVSLEREVDAIQDPFLRKALSLSVDGTDLADLRSIMEVDLELEAQEGKAEAKVFEAAGGYAPTVGIIGAVLGLIQVMKNLEQIEKVGHGIAVAFVATVYGIGIANLFFLPAAGKIRSRLEESLRNREMMLEGACAIAQGLHPRLIERKLEAYAAASAEKMEGKPATLRRATAQSAS